MPTQTPAKPPKKTPPKKSPSPRTKPGAKPMPPTLDAATETASKGKGNKEVPGRNVTSIKSATDFAVEFWPLHEIKPYEKNARKIPEAAIEKVAKSLKEFGWRQPMVVDEDGVLIVGHTRRLAAVHLGWTEGPVHVARDLTPEKIRAYRLMDNRSHQETEWDLDLLGSELSDLRLLDFDLSLTGFDDDELDRFLAEAETISDGFTDPDAIPAIPDDPITRPGDLWILGRHLLLCGDSTSIATVKRIMDGEKADICFTSPPYNVGRTPNGDEQKYANDSDDRDQSDYAQFLIDATNNALIAADYVFVNIQSVAGNKLALIDYLHSMRDRFSDYIIWDKMGAEPAMGENILNSRFEFVYVFSQDAKRRMGSVAFRGTLENIVQINSRQDKEFASVHKATFPVEFAEHFVANFAKLSVFEPFAGSGTTLIACERTGRKARLVELDPAYCDVIVKRWQDFTGKQATLVDDGRTFDDLKSAR
jgi:DNA modification methylase